MNPHERHSREGTMLMRGLEPAIPPADECKPFQCLVEGLSPGHGFEEARKGRHAVRTVVAVEAVSRPVGAAGGGVKRPSFQRLGNRHMGRHLRILRRARPIRLAVNRMPRHGHESGFEECVRLVVCPAEHRHGHGCHPVDWSALGGENGPVFECCEREHRCSSIEITKPSQRHRCRLTDLRRPGAA